METLYVYLLYGERFPSILCLRCHSRYFVNFEILLCKVREACGERECGVLVGYTFKSAGSIMTMENLALDGKLDEEEKHTYSCC